MSEPGKFNFVEVSQGKEFIPQDLDVQREGLAALWELADDDDNASEEEE